MVVVVAPPIAAAEDRVMRSVAGSGVWEVAMMIASISNHAAGGQVERVRGRAREGGRKGARWMMIMLCLHRGL